MMLKRKVPVVVLTAAALTLTACAQSERESGNTGSGAASGDLKDTFTFGAAGAPELFDPLYATDGETFRVTRQIHSGLLGVKPGTAEVQPDLAESWEPSADGLTWTFKLKQGVKFSDGEAVQRRGRLLQPQADVRAEGRRADRGRVLGVLLGTFSDKPETSLFKSCEAKDESTAVVTITRATSSSRRSSRSTRSRCSLPRRSRQGTPTTSRPRVRASRTPPTRLNPVGIGPYKLQKYDEANKTVTLVANETYFGEQPKTKNLVFKIIADESTRRQELEAGSIDGYDLPNPVDWKGLEDEGNKVEVRPAFNILYMGLNPKKNPKLKDLKVRQALYYALNRDQMVKTQLPEGAKVATQFMPDTVSGYNTCSSRTLRP